MSKFKLGQVWLNRQGKKFGIFQKITKGVLFDQGYRFYATTVSDFSDFDPHVRVHTSLTIAITADGKNNSENVSSPYDLVRIVPPDIRPGDQVSDMDGHRPTWASFQDWTIYRPFVISSEMFQAMHGKLPSSGDLVMNKMAECVSVGRDRSGAMESILIIYRYDMYYYCATLFRPDVMVPNKDESLINFYASHGVT